MGLVALSDWETLPEDDLHDVECSEGILIVVPKPSPRHQYVASALSHVLTRQLQPELRAIADVDILLETEPLTVRAPDVTVVADEAYAANPPRFVAAQVRLAVEVLSPGTRRQDRVTKMSEYAEAGITQYWIVDLREAGIGLAAYRLGGGGSYELEGTYLGRAELRVAGEPVTLDFVALEA